MTKKNNDATTAPIPLPNHHIHRTHSEVQLAQDQLVADYQDGKMYERILIGIMRRCDELGSCHPKTSSSLENIVNTKMQDFRSLSERGTTDAKEDWVVGDDDEPSYSIEEERTASFISTSLTSSENIGSERRNSSLSSLSCLTSHMDGTADATHDIESGIFELEL
mmetsp:Transcript_31086/g.40189  ORF Transcript_31086/g.40189 Transcript_31086/m.40189 type:complete len:165 (-) Transcript_31086:143-637(-)